LLTAKSTEIEPAIEESKKGHYSVRWHKSSKHVSNHHEAEDDEFVTSIGYEFKEIGVSKVKAHEHSFEHGGLKQPEEESL